MSSEPWQYDAVTLARMVRNREVSPTEVVEAQLARIDAVNPRLNAIVRRMDDEARAAAARVAASPTGPLAGVPVTSKITNEHTGHPTDNGVKPFAGLTATAMSPVLQGLADAGGVFVGRTNSPAMAMRLDTDNALHGRTHNPHRAGITAGGSSGGAAVAVATGMCTVAQGNDIGGSIRWPAFANGIVGLRPTKGRLDTGPTNPEMARPYAGQLMSTNGPLARTVADARVAFHAMVTDQWTDPLIAPVPLELPAPEGRLRVAVVTDDGLPMHEATRTALRTAASHLADAGYDVVEVRPPMLEELFTLWVRIGGTELAGTLMPMLPAIGDEGLTSFFESVMEIQQPLDIAGYLEALRVRDVVQRVWNRFLANHPLVITPTFCAPWMENAADTRGVAAVRTVMDEARYLLGLPVLGLPGLAVPVGSFDGQPQGVTIVGRKWRDDQCLAAGEEIEKREGERVVIDPTW